MIDKVKQRLRQERWLREHPKYVCPSQQKKILAAQVCTMVRRFVKISKMYDQLKRRCRVCGEIKLREEFRERKSWVVNTECKKCEQRRIYKCRDRIREEIGEELHKELKSAYNRDWYDRKRKDEGYQKKLKADRKRYLEENRDRANEYCRDYYWRDVVNQRRKHRIRWQEHREYYNEMSRKWERMRRSKYKGKIVGTHTYEEWIKKLKDYDYKCAYCGCGLHMTKDNRDRQQVTRDHVISLHDSGTDHISNIVPCCRRCNSSKGKGLVPKTKFGGAV